MSYYQKYLKYKNKYVALKNKVGGSNFLENIVPIYNLENNIVTDSGDKYKANMSANLIIIRYNNYYYWFIPKTNTFSKNYADYVHADSYKEIIDPQKIINSNEFNKLLKISKDYYELYQEMGPKNFCVEMQSLLCKIGKPTRGGFCHGQIKTKCNAYGSQSFHEDVLLQSIQNHDLIVETLNKKR